MDPSLPWAMQTLVVTVQQFKISSRACSRFKPIHLQNGSRGMSSGKLQAHSFAAILEDGSVVASGAADFGGDSSAVQDQLRFV